MLIIFSSYCIYSVLEHSACYKYYIMQTINMLFSNIDFDECESDPCLNGAECKNGAKEYTCTCVPGYTGRNCETGQIKNLNSVLFAHKNR